MVESENHAGVCFWGDIIERADNKWYTKGPFGGSSRNPSRWDYSEAKGLRVFRPTLEKVTSQMIGLRSRVLRKGIV